MLWHRCQGSALLKYSFLLDLFTSLKWLMRLLCWPHLPFCQDWLSAYARLHAAAQTSHRR